MLRIENKIPKEKKNTILKFPDVNNENEYCFDFLHVASRNVNNYKCFKNNNSLPHTHTFVPFFDFKTITVV